MGISEIFGTIRDRMARKQAEAVSTFQGMARQIAAAEYFIIELADRFIRHPRQTQIALPTKFDRAMMRRLHPNG